MKFLILENANPFTTEQIIYLIVAPIVVILLIVAIVLPFILRHLHNKNFKNYFYKKIYRIALNKDFYLINKFHIKLESEKVSTIDHILFGDKYFYVIIDRFYEGDLGGKNSDKSLIFINKKGVKFYADNPITESKNIVTRLSYLTGVNVEMLIGIVLINDDCETKIESDSNQFFICQRKHLNSLVKDIESRPVGKLNPEELQSAVLTIKKLDIQKAKK